MPSGLPDEDFFVCEMENWIKICTVRLVKFPELCYYFQYVRVQFVRLAARLLHKKNNVVSRCARVYLKTHDVTGSEGFLRCARHFFAGILTYFKEK